MRIKLSTIFLVFPLFLFAQVKISGRVFDKETQEPIPFVAIYTNNQSTNSQSTLTDEQGYFNLIINHSDSVYFQHLAYNFYAVPSSVLLQNSTVNLVPQAVELADVTISPIDAQSLLKKAGQNLIEKLKEKDTRSYLFHVEESNTIGKERELYALIDAAFNRYNPVGKFYMWNFNLYQLDKVKEGSQGDFYGKIAYPLIRLFPFESINPKSGDFIYSVQDIDSNYFMLKETPIHPDKKHYRYTIYKINKQDTVPIEITSQSLSDAEQFTRHDYKGTDLGIMTQFSTNKIVKDKETGYYYFQEVKNIGSINMKTNNSDFNVIFLSTASVLNNYSTTQGNAKKKIGFLFQLFDKTLFETDFPNSSGFWKQYVK